MKNIGCTNLLLSCTLRTSTTVIMDSKDSGSLQARTSNSNNINNSSSSSSGEEEAAPPRTKSELQEEIQKTVYGQYKVHCHCHFAKIVWHLH